jgi:hypothetical protein
MAVALLDPVATFAGPPEEYDLPRAEWKMLQEDWSQQCP